MWEKRLFGCIVALITLVFFLVPAFLCGIGILNHTGYDIVVDFIVPWINVYVTLILSIFIWKIDKKSVEITQKMDEQEIERDRLVLIETANKLYFSLVNIFEYLCFHYANQKSEKEVYISDDWTSDLAKMRIVLSDVEIKKIFDLFRNVLVLKEKCTKENFENVCKFCMIPYLLNLYANDTFSDKISFEDMMNRTIKNAFEKIKLLCVLKRMDDIGNISSLESENIYEKMYSEQNVGIRMTYIGGEIDSIKIFDTNGKIILDGTIKPEGYTGYKEEYKDDQLVEKGQYENGKLINGIKYHVYKDNDVQDNEQVEEEIEMPAYTERYYKELEVKNGEVIYNENKSNYEYKYIY